MQNDSIATATVKRCTKWCMQWLAKCGQLGCLPWSALQKLEHSLMLPERNNVTHCDNGLTLTPNCHPGKSIVHHYHSPFLNINKWNCSAVFSRSALFSTLWRACHSSQGPFRSSVPKLRLSRLSTCKLWNIWSFSCSHPFQFATNLHFHSHWPKESQKRTSKCCRPRAHKMLEAWMCYRLNLIIPSSTLRSIHSPSRLPADIRTTQRTCSE